MLPWRNVTLRNIWVMNFMIFFLQGKNYRDCTKIPKVPNPKSTQPKVPNLPFSPNLYSTYKRMNF